MLGVRLNKCNFLTYIRIVLYSAGEIYERFFKDGGELGSNLRLDLLPAMKEEEGKSGYCYKFH